jgi:hypothetical protein
MRRRKFLTATSSAVGVGISGCAQLSVTDLLNSAEYPPGVTEDGVQEIITLRTAHRDGLSTFSRQQSIEYKATNNRRVVESGHQVKTVGVDTDSELIEITEHGDPLPRFLAAPFTGLWTNGDKVAIRKGRGENADVEIQDDPPSWPSFAATERVGRSLGDAILVGSEETIRGQLVWLRSTGNPRRVDEIQRPTSFSALASVREEGVVEFLYERIRGRGRGKLIEVSITNRFNGIGKTAVDRPGWAFQ